MEKLFPWAWQALKQADDRLRLHQANPLSLDPNKDTITPFVKLGKDHIHSNLETEFLKAAIAGFCSIVDSQIYHFPENIFWDFDYLFAIIFNLKSPSQCEQYCKSIVELQMGYGIHSQVRFQYMHDFTYGFDWARWVVKDPQNRRTIKPLDEIFITYLKQRLTELIKLIASNDSKYPQLNTNAPRNPYPFARTFEAEKKLHNALAARDLIPVEAWKSTPKIDWCKDYSRMRDTLSAEKK
ncbi:MAG: hypothetical protein AB8G05_28175 [Oligoflexales bacterium]